MKTQDDNKALAILKKLYLDGKVIQEEFEDQNYEQRAEARAISWLQRARLLFGGIFYNQKYLKDFNGAVQEAYSSFNESMNYHVIKLYVHMFSSSCNNTSLLSIVDKQ